MLETLNSLASQPVVMFVLGLVGVYLAQFVKKVAERHAENSQHWDFRGGALDALGWLKRRLVYVLVGSALAAGALWLVFDPCNKPKDQLSAEEFQKCDLRKSSLSFF
jgi:hypothetical protein